MDGSGRGEGAVWARLRALWERERAAVRARGAEARASRSFPERVRAGEALGDLEIEETDAAPGGRVLLWVAPRRQVDLGALRVGPGDPVRLWPAEAASRGGPDSPDAVRAVVSRRARGRLGVVLDGDVPEALEAGGFRLDLDDPEATFERGFRALARFAEAPRGSDRARLGAVLTGGRRPDVGPPPPWSPRDAALNEAQRRAVSLALAARDVALIHGPPGTGKTRTLAEVVVQAVAAGDRVLVTAASNTAVDNLAERLQAGGQDVVRLGHPARVSQTLQGRTLDALLEDTEAWRLARRWVSEANALRARARKRGARGTLRHAERRALWAEARSLERDARRQLRGAQQGILDAAQVVCATAAGADASLLGGRRFELVVLDEATQAPDPVALVPLSRAERVVMAGDPRQLPPTVIDPTAAADGLASTWFERLAERAPDVCVLLDVQHRMHEALMAFPSAREYEGRLQAHPSVARRVLAELPGVAEDPLRPGPWTFVDTAGKGWDERREREEPGTPGAASVSNPGQAGRTVAEVRRLLGRGLAPGDAAVITPYWAQVLLLRDALAPEVAAGLEVGTVDGFQGREKEAIVVDLVRSNGEQRLGFLTDTRRMNVALTRARRALIVVGDSATLGAHPYYQAFLGAAEEAGAWLSAWADDAPPFDA